MNENLNLVEILKDCPKGTKFYCPLFGDAYFEYVAKSYLTYPIVVSDTKGNPHLFCSDGKFVSGFDGSECFLFPSKENRDWSTFKAPVKKFKITDFKPFDKVLCRDLDTVRWRCGLFSNLVNEKNEQDIYAETICGWYNKVIPYNDETAHLVGTAEDCPDYYKWWER